MCVEHSQIRRHTILLKTQCDHSWVDCNNEHIGGDDDDFLDNYEQWVVISTNRAYTTEHEDFSHTFGYSNCQQWARKFYLMHVLLLFDKKRDIFAHFMNELCLWIDIVFLCNSNPCLNNRINEIYPIFRFIFTFLFLIGFFRYFGFRVFFANYQFVILNYKFE